MLCEVAIAACDLAEVLGSAIGLKLLFGLPLLAGVLITALDTFVLLLLQRRGMRTMEAFIVVLVTTIGVCFGIEILLSKPESGRDGRRPRPLAARRRARSTWPSASSARR